MGVLSAAVSQFVPYINSTGGRNRKGCTKVPREIRKCLSRKRSLWKKVKLNRFDTRVRAKYRECCFKYKSLIQQHELHTEENVINANQIGSFYRFINKRIYNRSDIGVLVDTTNNAVIVNSSDKANVLNAYFASVWRKDNNTTPICDSLNVIPIENVNLDSDDVLRAIHKLKSNYTCGPDGFPAIFFKRLKFVLAVPLSILFNQLLSVSYVPSIWKKAIITPVHKKGPTTDCVNYRPISITCVSCKLLERIIVNKLNNHFTLNNILHDAQHGFIKGRSTFTNLLESLNDWTLCLQNKDQVDIIYIDFSKAFDVVTHEKLFTRLYSYGIRGDLLLWLKRLYTGRTHCTKVDDVLSDETDMISGVIQGSVIGPMMFLVFINELIEILDSYGIKVKFFADDAKLYVKIMNNIDSALLQVALNALYSWAAKWQLTIAVEKCCVLHIGRVSPSPIAYLIDNTCLPVVSSCRDLGVTITTDLSPSLHISDIVAKAHRRSNAIHRCFISRNVQMLIRAFLVYVRPLLEFNSPIWSPHYKQDIELIERVQRRFTKRLPGYGNLTYNDRLALLNLPSLELRRLRIDLISSYKILFGHTNINIHELFEFRQTTTRGHPYKLYKSQCTSVVRSSFFTQRIINVWNDLPVNIVDFSSLACFKRSLEKVNFSKYLVQS